MGVINIESGWKLWIRTSTAGSRITRPCQRTRWPCSTAPPTKRRRLVLISQTDGVGFGQWHEKDDGIERLEICRRPWVPSARRGRFLHSGTEHVQHLQE